MKQSTHQQNKFDAISGDSDERPDGDDVLDVELFLVPKGVVLPTSVGKVVDVANLKELVRALEETDKLGAFLVAHIENADLRTLVSRSPDLIPVRAAVLTDVPGGDYDVLFDNSTYTLMSIPLIDVASSIDQLTRGANQEAQSILEGTGATKSEKMERRAARISTSVVSRTSATAPKPQSLAEALAAEGSGDEDDEA